MSPKSPTRTRRPKRNADGIPGMIVAPRPKVKPIEEMDMDELRALHTKNEGILSSPSASSSSVATRVAAEQAQVRIRIWEMERKEMEGLQNELKVMAIVEDNDMAVDTELSVNGVNGTWGSEGGTVNGNGVGQKNVFVSARAQTKQRALAAWGNISELTKTETIPLQEALELEKQSFAQETERRNRIQEKKDKWGSQWPTREQPMSRAERDMRIWAFMNYKPTDSDLEDEDDPDDDDDDPARWFEDDQDDGLKGQDIIYPDAEDLAELIRLDDGKLYDRMYEPHEDGD